MIGRREFVTLLGGAATAWPLAARAQQPTMPVVGFLSARSPASGAFMAAAFRQGLSESGYVEGRNLRIEYRWAEGHYDRLAELADDLVRRQVAVIAAISGTPAALAAKAATTTIPIVFANGGDPVTSGLVASLNRPAGNVTGVTFYTVALAGKRLELMRALVPAAVAMGFFVNQNNPAEEPETNDAEAAARALGVRLHVLNTTSERDIDAAFRTLLERRADALVVGSDPVFFGFSSKLVDLTARYAVPAVYYVREFISDNADGIACWFIDTDYNEESFFVRHAYFLGANDPYSALKTTLKAEVDPEAWATLHSDTSRPFDKPSKGRIAVKVINHLGDEVMKVFRV
jgi:putative ABC transport system substrate-binding protein